MKTVLILIALLFSIPAISQNACSGMSDEKLLGLLIESEKRINCRASLGAGAACVGIATGLGSASLGVAVVAKHLKVGNIQSNLLRITQIEQEMRGLAGRQQAIAKSGDLRLATNDSGDADIKRSYAKLEIELTKITQQISEAMKSDPKSVGKALERIKNQPSGSEKLKFLQESLFKLSSVASVNPNEAKTYHKLVEGFEDSIRALINAVNHNENLSKAVSQLRIGLGKTASVGKSVLGSRVLAFFGSATFSGLGLFFYSSENTKACESSIENQYINYGEDCRAIVGINQNVLEFLNKSPTEQIRDLKSFPKVCEFYLGLAQSLRLDDANAEGNARNIKNLRCEKNISFDIQNSNYQIKLKDNEVASITENTANKLNFSSKGQLSQSCENGKCDSIQMGSNKKLVVAAVKKLSDIKFAVAEAQNCCNSSGDDKTSCIEKFSGTQNKSFEKSSSKSGAR